MSETQQSSGALEPRTSTAPPAAYTEAQRTVVEPPPWSFPLSFGWTLVLLATLFLAVMSWTLYGTEAAGMWAGYRDQLFGIVLGFVLAGLRCDVPKAPLIGLTGLIGVGVLLLGVFVGETTAIQITEIAGGVVIVLGSALMMTAHDR